MGVGTREMGYLFGQYRRLAGHFQVIHTFSNPNKLFGGNINILPFFLYIFPCMFIPQIRIAWCTLYKNINRINPNDQGKNE